MLKNNDNTKYRNEEFNDHHFRASQGIRVSMQGVEHDYVAREDEDMHTMAMFKYHWFGLYNRLTYREANALYRLLSVRTFDEAQTVIRLNSPSSCLYFLNKGIVNIIVKHDDELNERFKLGPGNIIGSEGYFSGNESHVSVVSWEKTEFDCLERHDLDTLSKQFPDLENKLYEFCKSLNRHYIKPGPHFEERREYQRIEISGTVIGDLVDSSGAPLGCRLNGNLINISKGGFSFSINSDNCMEMVGSNLEARLGIDIENTVKEFDWKGRIVGVHRAGDTFSIHVMGVQPAEVLH